MDVLMAAIGKVGDGAIIAIAIYLIVKELSARRRIKESTGGEVQTPEALAAGTLAELKRLSDTFERHDKQDRAEFKQLLKEMQKSDDHLSGQISELRDEIRNNAGRATELEKRQAVHEYRIKALEERRR